MTEGVMGRSSRKTKQNLTQGVRKNVYVPYIFLLKGPIRGGFFLPTTVSKHFLCLNADSDSPRQTVCTSAGKIWRSRTC